MGDKLTREEKQQARADKKARAATIKAERNALKVSQQGFAREARANAAVDKARILAADKARKSYPADHAKWAERVSDLKRMLHDAQTFQGEASTGILLKKDERQYAHIPAQLIEDRAGKRTFVAGHQGVSIPIGKIAGRSVRYYAGKSKGRSVQAPPVATVIDTGHIFVTNQRIVFQGVKATRESLFSKMVGYEHVAVGETVVSVTNRQKPSRFRYPVEQSNWFQFVLILAVSDFRGQRGELVQDLASRLDAETRAEPQLR